jgi:hypothetical protein
MEDKILEIIKEESENANVRKYTCINGFGYSQFERNIAERVVKLFCQPDVKSSNAFERLPLHWKLLYYYVGGIITGLLLHYCF